MPHTGEEPGAGLYRCTRCGQAVHLDDAGDRLPPCPECHHTEFVSASLTERPRGARSARRLNED
ncbi:MAG: hypothetical protein DIU55_010190 [Bacillota bacterium]|nr:MAG: hypothetical protein DIU69_04215 [Bacillota bacterium]